MPKNILVIGSGAREHSLVIGLKKSSNCSEIYALPGNAGINQIATGVDINQSDFESIAKFCAGKGVTVAFSVEEAKDAVIEAFGGKFGAAGQKLVIEDFLEGEEASFFAILDGDTAVQIGSAQDHKQLYDGDKGPNTGGMGTYSPAPVVTSSVAKKVMDEIITPTIEGLKSDGIIYKGFLFAGLMIDKEGNPKLIEYNIRFGDPEAQVIIPRIETDLVELIEGAIDGKLSELGDISLGYSLRE